MTGNTAERDTTNVPSRTLTLLVKAHGLNPLSTGVTQAKGDSSNLVLNFHKVGELTRYKFKK